MYDAKLLHVTHTLDVWGQEKPALEVPSHVEDVLFEFTALATNRVAR